MVQTIGAIRMNGEERRAKLRDGGDGFADDAPLAKERESLLGRPPISIFEEERFKHLLLPRPVGCTSSGPTKTSSRFHSCAASVRRYKLADERLRRSCAKPLKVGTKRTAVAEREYGVLALRRRLRQWPQVKATLRAAAAAAVGL